MLPSGSFSAPSSRAIDEFREHEQVVREDGEADEDLETGPARAEASTHAAATHEH